MTFEILVSPVERGFKATVIGLDNHSVVAPTRAEALEKVQSELDAELRNGEVVKMEVATRRIDPFIGIWEHDPLQEEFLQAVADYRKQVDEDPNQP